MERRHKERIITRARSHSASDEFTFQINYYVELLIDFNGNKLAAREAVNGR